MEHDFYVGNRTRLTNELSSDGTVVIFGSSGPYRNASGYYGRALDMNFFYLTGLSTSDAILLIHKEGDSSHERLFISRRDPDQEKWSGRRISAEDAGAASGVRDVAYLAEFDAFLENTLAHETPARLFLDIPDWYADDVPPPIETFLRRVERDYPGTIIENICNTLARLRTRKQPEEVACIRRAIANAKVGIDAMVTAVRPGMREYELQAVCYHALHSRGEMKAAPMVAAGGNAVILHYPEADATIRDDDLVLVDFCPRFNHYASDISRAFPASGRFTPRQRELYTVALDANKRMIENVRPGLTFAQMNRMAREYLGEGMRAIGLIDSDDEVARYYYHNVSHYLGLGIHDVGDTDQPIPVDAVLTIDAGVYVAEEGTGLRVEDDVLITRDGCENLSSSIPKEIDDVEHFMATVRRAT